MSAKYKLCSFKTCPWVHRAAIVLQEKGVAYDIDYIDRDNRPDWFLAISPHSKVPVLVIDDDQALFESNAIAEYLEETIEPRLHPADPILRARNRAWTDYVPIFSRVSNLNYAESEGDLKERLAVIPERFQLLENALAARGNDGPFFNGADFSLVDAAYAPALMRFTFFDNIRPVGVIEKFPLVMAWRDALLARPSVLAAVVPEFETYWRDQLRERGRWSAQFIPGAAAAE